MQTGNTDHVQQFLDQSIRLFNLKRIGGTSFMYESFSLVDYGNLWYDALEKLLGAGEFVLGVAEASEIDNSAIERERLVLEEYAYTLRTALLNAKISEDIRQTSPPLMMLLVNGRQTGESYIPPIPVSVQLVAIDAKVKLRLDPDLLRTFKSAFLKEVDPTDRIEANHILDTIYPPDSDPVVPERMTSGLGTFVVLASAAAFTGLWLGYRKKK